MYSIDLAHVHDSGFGKFAAEVAPHVHALLKRHGIRKGTVIEVGCGSGILARHLSDAGYDVVGLDVSAAMIRLARVKAPRARFRVGSLATVAIPRCDAVICLGEVVTYVAGGLPALRRFFTRVHRALAPDGLLLFDFIHSAQTRTYPPKTLHGRGWTLTVRADVDARTRVLRRRMVVTRRVGARTRRTRETHRVRIYDPRELVATLERIGFQVKTDRAVGHYRLMSGDTAILARKRTLG